MITSHLQFDTVFDPPDSVTSPIERGLHDFNLSVLGPDVIYNYAKFAVFVRGEQGQVAGGLIGELVWGWLHINTLWVADSLRGCDIGTRLLQLAEAAARERGVCQATLETTSFQARDFYLKNGFTITGAVEGKPAGHTWYYMMKAF